MKTLNKILILFLFIGFIQIGDVQAQSLKEIREKAKKEAAARLKAKRDKKNKTTTTTTTTTNTNNTQTNTNTNTQTETETSDELIIDPNNPVEIELQSFLEVLKLDRKTNKLSFKNITLSNLPISSYRTDADDHKLTAVLKLDNQELHKFPFVCKVEIANIWNDAVQKDSQYATTDYTITKAGSYVLEIQVDGKKATQFDFDILKIDREKETGLFLNKPFSNFATVECAKFEFNYNYDLKKSVKTPLIQKEFIFNYYNAEFKPKFGINEYVSRYVRLMKVNAGGDDICLGGDYSDEHARPTRMKLENVFFRLDRNSQYVTYETILNSDGKYYIDLILAGERFRYDFEVKDKKITSEFKNPYVNGINRVERKVLAYPEYVSFKPTASISGIKDNIRMSVKTTKSDGASSTQGNAATKPITFRDGQIISPSIYLSDDVKKKYSHRFTEFIVSLKKGNETIAQHINFAVYSGGSNGDFVWLMQDRSEKGEIYQRYNTGQFMGALAKLPAGNHKLRLVWEMTSGDKTDIVAVRTVTFSSKSGNPKYTKWAKDTEDLLLLSRNEMQDLAFSTSSSTDYVYYVNTCGRLVWIRQESVKEYYMYSGDKIKLDRSRGYIEQWNFGTKKWKTTNDFKPYKTIYRLEGVALLDLQRKQEEWPSKLKPLLGKEFKNEVLYLAAVEKLIGKEKVVEFRNMIIMAANIDYVKICQ